MKSLLRIFLPTFILFSIFARITALDNLHRNLPGGVTEITLSALMFYFSYFAPLLFVILILTQYLIIMPLWRRFTNSYSTVAQMFIIVLVAVFLPAFFMSYVIWDKALGNISLLRSVATLFSVQIIYWVLNLFILYLIDRAYTLKQSARANA